MPGRTIHLVLELDAETEPIAGTLQREDGELTHFHGWLELTEGVESARRSGWDVSPSSPSVRPPAGVGSPRSAS
jgi:hypothetical protein